MCPSRWLPVVLAVALAACTGADRDADAAVGATAAAQEPAAGGVEASAPAAAPLPAASAPVVGPAQDVDAPDDATVGGDGSRIVLSPLSPGDVEDAAFSGELGCAFSTGDAAPLLVANGNVASDAPARGVVKVGDYVEAIAAPGGFDAMQRGTRFSGAGKTITIAVTGAAVGGGESPAKPATLTYDRADGARRTFDGRWRCGP